MPNYTFYNKKKRYKRVLEMTIAEWREFKKDPDEEQLIVTAPGIGDPIRLGLEKPSDHFRDRLRDIKSSHRGSTINTF